MKKILATIHALFALAALADVGEAQYLMVDQKGKIEPAGAVATIADTVKTETKLAALEVAAVAYTNAAAKTEAAVDDLAAAIIGNSLVVYEDDFVYSLGDAIAISTNCKCRVYRFEATKTRVEIDGEQYARSWLYFGFTENIGSLNPVAEFKDSLAKELDWGEVICSTPEVQNHTFTHGTDEYAYCYKMSVDIPVEYEAAFIRVFTAITAQVGDGSVLNISGGIAGGLDGEVTLSGGGKITFKGGLAVVPTEGN
jgi:hypothetical protein